MGIVKKAGIKPCFFIFDRPVRTHRFSGQQRITGPCEQSRDTNHVAQFHARFHPKRVPSFACAKDLPQPCAFAKPCTPAKA
ncbi:hypothetical protein IHE49_16755 [Rhodanobacter sp. 7MK24]|uniref:hypothetical protein n=1 Tax=Rhodanobacter sp. 7MK24 TaxID=2775922 RepID=UPI00177E2458|nr:hypothetical protein [Rhodanobacter sp. 7MK24]MBD8882134.1 hypothetical protein [Rhodanobacter sp. 7MK24]